MRKVIVNGAFDILHPGHLDLINYAKSLGDFLLVAIDSDERIREAKGGDRPINDVQTRKIMMANLKAVDDVIIFASDEELENIFKGGSGHQVDVRVIGSDWYGKPIVGEGLVPELIYYERVNDKSTTAIVTRIRGQ
jgi:D-beta-D-heptose 7-phosphate kinase/D-beta-D-heptose 1-phosphate adenosyltransferase